MKAVIWDFDGTLASRHGMWSGALAAIANRQFPERCVSRDEVRSFFQAGFPWDAPDVPHSCNSSEEWWSSLDPMFRNVYLELGFDEAAVQMLCKQVRQEYSDLSESLIYDDVIACLTSLSALGWSHYMLSNHVPELPQLVTELGLSSFFAGVYTSACIGFEKPNPEAFKYVLRELPSERTVWMVGDNPIADVQGGMAMGIPSILVRDSRVDVEYCCMSLSERASVIDAQQ